MVKTFSKKGLIVVFIVLIAVVYLITSKTKAANKLIFNWRITAPGMIVNKERCNIIEGTYLRVSNLNEADCYIEIEDLPATFFLTLEKSEWFIGWGDGDRYYNRGNENLAEIVGWDTLKKRFYLADLDKFPQLNQEVVLWRKSLNYLRPLGHEMIIHSEDILGYPSQSMSFSRVLYDDLSTNYFMFVQPVDEDETPIFLLKSNDLRNWSNALGDKAVFDADFFKGVEWTNNESILKKGTCPQISDFIFHNGSWYLFITGINSKNERQIGVVKSKTGIFGPYVLDPSPLLSNGKRNTWNEAGVFYPKVLKRDNCFQLFYDGVSKDGKEAVGVANSFDFITWDHYNKNPVINEHSGWRSDKRVSEPAYVEASGDTTFLLVAGAKEFNDEWYHKKIFRNSYISAKGNVDQTQLGIYMSLDGGYTFVAHSNNPVFTNNFGNKYENAHLGANFSIVEKQDTTFYFYQAKTSFPKLRYVIKAYFVVK